MFPHDFEARLVARFRDGDSRAMETLFDAYFDRAFRFASLLTDSREDAEEVVQEAFVKAFRKARQIHRDTERFGPWLYAVVRSTAADHRRQLRLPVMTPNETQLVDAAGPEDVIVEMEQRRRFRDALASLSEDHQSVLVICDLEEIDHADAARMLGKSLTATKSLLYRARRALRDACIAREVSVP